MIENILEELNMLKNKYESYASLNTLDKEVHLRNYYMSKGIQEAIDLINNMR